MRVLMAGVVDPFATGGRAATFLDAGGAAGVR